MVAGTLVALVVATVNLVDGDDPAPGGGLARQVVGTPTAAPSEGVVAGPRKGRKGNKGKGDKGTGQTVQPTYTPAPEPPPAEPEGRCDDADVVVTPVMADAVAGRSVLVTLELRTRDAEACTWTIGPESLAYKVTDTDEEDVWSSSQCPSQVPTDDIVVRRDDVATYRLAWNGRASSLDCPAMRHVSPGDYAVQAAAIGGEPSEVVPFVLDDPAAVVPEGPIGPPVPESTDRSAGTSTGKNKGRTKSKGTDRPRSD
jgi:hypothetical protein